ncbi:MAG: hypothetical protein Q7Q71_03645 [Verrucomicrobiota bacterium JB023]|nr:hypothetical protein [Verrucomicrobiota bacterium JB023]
MNKQLSSVLVIAFGLLGALFVVFQVLSTGKNALGEAYKYFLPMAFFIGLLAPRFACYLLAFFAVYIDVGKKLLVVGESLYFADLFYILGIPPVMLLGACLSKALALFWNWTSSSMKMQRESFLLACGLILAVSLVVVIRSGVSAESVKELANSAAYLGLIFLVPAVFREKGEMLHYLKVIVFLMVPGALYGLYHFFFGMNEFELIYYSSGLSMNEIYVLSGEGVFGPFSSQGALSSSMMISALFCALVYFLGPEERPRFLNPVLAACLFIVFFATAILSLKRGPLLILPVALVLYLVLRSRGGLVLSLLGGAAMILLFVFTGDWVADQLPNWQLALNKMLGVESSTEQNLFRIRTLNVRMVEFASLSDPENWVPFGLAFGQGNEKYDYAVHAGIVGMVHKLGYVPLIALLLIFLPCIWVVHGIYLKVLRMGVRYANLLFCIGAATLVVPMLGLSNFSVFPVPFLAGLCFGAFWRARYFVDAKATEKADDTETEEIPILAGHYAN